MKKILGLTVAALMVMGLVGSGTWAYFSDTESVNSNVFSAGTIDLKVDGNEWTSPLSLTNLKPGDTSSAIVFLNNGTLEGEITFSWASLSESDHALDTSATFEYAGGTTGSIEPDYEMDAEQYSRLIYVTISGSGGATDIVAETDITGNNGDSKISLKELMDYTDPVATLPNGASITVTFILADAFDGGSSAAPADWTDYLGGSPTFDILEAVAWNVPQADGLTVNISAELAQTS
jgi:predicted ribosomally synthesized peptide with SipW-like signal peptide